MHRMLGVVLGVLLIMTACGTAPSTETASPTSVMTSTPTEQPAPTATARPTRTATPTPIPPTPTNLPRNERVGWILVALWEPTDASSDIYLLSPDGGDLIPLGLSTLGNVGQPSWSPDYQYVAFAISNKKPTRAFDIYTVNIGCLDTSEGCLSHVVNLTDEDDESLNSSPSWSPDGTKILFARLDRPNIAGHIWQMNPDGSDKQQLTPLQGSQPDWSPDGMYFVFSSTVRDEEWGFPTLDPAKLPPGLVLPNIFIADADGRNVRRLTNTLPDAGSPAWSPDGTQILIVSLEGRDPYIGGPAHVFTVKPDGTVLRRISTGRTGGGNPVWSPDGQYILYQQRDEQEILFHLVRYAVDTSETTILLSDPNGFDAAWAP